MAARHQGSVRVADDAICQRVILCLLDTHQRLVRFRALCEIRLDATVFEHEVLADDDPDVIDFNAAIGNDGFVVSISIVESENLS